MIVSSIPYQLDYFSLVTRMLQLSIFTLFFLRWCWLLFYVYEFWKTENLDLKLKHKKCITKLNATILTVPKTI